MISLTRRLIEGTAVNLIAVVFNQGSTLIANILVARILMQQSFGEYSLLQVTLLAISPPFQSMTDDEDEAIVAQINASRAGVVFELEMP